MSGHPDPVRPANRCPVCGKVVTQARRGRAKVYCDDACRLVAHRRRLRAAETESPASLRTWWELTSGEVVELTAAVSTWSVVVGGEVAAEGVADDTRHAQRIAEGAAARAGLRPPTVLHWHPGLW